MLAISNGSSKKTPSGLPVMFGVLATFALSAGLILAGARLSFIYKAAESEGVVIENIARRSTNQGETNTMIYYPVVEFISQSRQTIKFESGVGSDPAQFDVGDKTSVLYQPSRPENALINRFMNIWFLPLLFSGLGSIFFFVRRMLKKRMTKTS